MYMLLYDHKLENGKRTGQKLKNVKTNMKM